MRKYFTLLFILFRFVCSAQSDSSQWLRAFPITDYIVDLADSFKVVQLEMPEGYSLKEKQLGLIYGVYNGKREEVVQKGYGRCQLIKGAYYYFSIGHNNSGLQLSKGDLLYTFMDKTDIYFGLFPQLAAHFIRLQNVHDEPFYDRYNIFRRWTEDDEQMLMDSVISDIKYTGKYFFENNPSMNAQISEGDYSGKKIFDVMIATEPKDLEKFLRYVIGHPRLYAGKEWKITEIYATWLQNGAPN